MKFALLISLFTFTVSSFSQIDPDKDRNWRIEVEPASFFLKGFSGSVQYSVTEDNNLSVGIFTAGADVPDFTRPGMFNNVGNSDTSRARLGFQIALMVRYKIPLFKQFESNPYIGFIGGWEYFDIEQPINPTKLRLTTFVITPYVGYEIYYFKKMLYVNPQVRGVFYAGKTSSDINRPESLKNFLLLPQISVGIRL